MATARRSCGASSGSCSPAIIASSTGCARPHSSIGSSRSSKSRSDCCARVQRGRGMDFTLTPEQTMMAETARRIGEKFGLEYWRELDRTKSYPKEIWQAICEAGLCGVALPEEHGGAGLGMVEM